MSQIEHVEDLAGDVAGMEIDGPTTDDERVVETDEEHAAPGEDDESAASKETTFELRTAEGSTGPLPLHVLDEAAKRAGTEDSLFDDSSYIDVPTMDGQASDFLAFAFNGGVKFEANDEDAQRLFEALTLGKEVEIRVAADVVKKIGAWKRKADDTEVVTGQITLKVHTLRVLTPEELT